MELVPLAKLVGEDEFHQPGEDRLASIHSYLLPGKGESMGCADPPLQVDESPDGQYV